jgi:pSer/pThr/pTyr-binding forkhead associated (FHA) protein
MLYRDMGDNKIKVEADKKVHDLGFEDYYISRRKRGREGHFCIRKFDEEYRLRDTGSKNGTYINYNLINGFKKEIGSDWVSVKAGDVIGVGLTELRIEDSEDSLTVHVGEVIRKPKDKVIPREIVQKEVKLGDEVYVRIKEVVSSAFKNVVILKSDKERVKSQILYCCANAIEALHINDRHKLMSQLEILEKMYENELTSLDKSLHNELKILVGRVRLDRRFIEYALDDIRGLIERIKDMTYQGL